MVLIMRTHHIRRAMFVVLLTAIGWNVSSSVTWADEARQLYNQGLKELQRGNHSEAIDLLRRAIEQFPNYAEAHHLLGMAYANTRQTTSAESELKMAIALHPNFARAYHDLGLLYVHLGHLQQAEQTLTEAMAVYPRYEEAQLALAKLYEQRGDVAAATQAYRVVLSINRAQPVVLYNLAVLEDNQSHWNQAHDLLTELVKRYPSHAEGWSLLGRVAEREQNAGLAVQAYEQVIKLKPDVAEAHYNLGFLYQTRGEKDEAIGQFQEVCRLDPQNAEAHLNLGVLYAALNQMDTAEREYLEALRVNPKLLEGYYNLGLFYEFHRNDPQKALAQYRQYAALGGKDSRVQRLLGTVQSSPVE